MTPRPDGAPASADSPAPPAVRLRPIGPSDRDLLLAWANDPVTRAASFSVATIEPETHATWFARLLGDPDSRMWIGLVDGRPIGQVRVDRIAPERGEVGISVAPAARGRGLAAPLLRAGIDAAASHLGVRTFVALVRPDNVVSLRLFTGVGFEQVADGERRGVACRVLELHR